MNYLYYLIGSLFGGLLAVFIYIGVDMYKMRKDNIRRGNNVLKIWAALLPLFLLTAPPSYAQDVVPTEEKIVTDAKIRITLKDGQKFESYSGVNEKLYQSIVAGLADTNKTYIMIPMVDKTQTLLGYVTFLKTEITTVSYIQIFSKVDPGDIGQLEKLLEGDIKVPSEPAPEKPKPELDKDPGPPEPEEEKPEPANIKDSI